MHVSRWVFCFCFPTDLIFRKFGAAGLDKILFIDISLRHPNIWSIPVGIFARFSFIYFIILGQWYTLPRCPGRGPTAVRDGPPVPGVHTWANGVHPSVYGGGSWGEYCTGHSRTGVATIADGLDGVHPAEKRYKISVGWNLFGGMHSHLGASHSLQNLRTTPIKLLHPIS